MERTRKVSGLGFIRGTWYRDLIQEARSKLQKFLWNKFTEGKYDGHVMNEYVANLFLSCYKTKLQ
jgi:hypothetical protein